jgi:polyphosphate kinase
MYVQRYMPHLPAASEIVIFDRSWYNRAGAERVMGFCTEKQVKAFFAAVPLVERAMVDSGIKTPEILARGEPRGADEAA